VVDVTTIERWRETWRALEVAPAPGLHDELIACYSEPHRHYHTLQHLDECFTQLTELRPLAEHPNRLQPWHSGGIRSDIISALAVRKDTPCR
jgi:predicted metal-dependent HD superfamily phosphohydrolase